MSQTAVKILGWGLLSSSTSLSAYLGACQLPGDLSATLSLVSPVVLMHNVRTCEKEAQ